MSLSNLSRAVRGHRDLLLFAALVLAIAGCGKGCAGCDLAPLPAGGLPPDQTVEGGAQVRVTPTGVAKVEAIVGDVIGDALDTGICIPEVSTNIFLGDIEACFNNDGACTPGCQADLAVDSVNLTPESGQLRITAQFDVQSDVAVRFDPIIGGPIGCTLDVTANNTVVEAIVTVGIDPGTGEITVNLQDIPNLDVDPDIGGCGFVGAVISFIASTFSGVVEDLVLGLLEPQLADLVDGLLPDPLGIENTVDVSSFLSTLSPGTTGALEARLVPGGYAFVEGGGLSVGVISGINADVNPATRSPELDSEPALCVPPMAAPDLAAAPASLSRSPRNNFTLPAAGPFRGLGGDDPNSDVLLGLSETFLDMAGHHAVTSGALCLGLGTELIPQLNLGTIGIVVPSLAELGSPEGTDPLLLLTRPQKAVDFTVGDGTEESPSLTVHLHGFQIDFYAFLFQRFVRGFTVGLDLDVGVNLEFATDEQGNATILPVLVGLDPENVGVSVINEEFLREDGAVLEGVLPSLLDLALPLLAESLPSIELPEILGFRLEDLSLSRVTDAQDHSFLAVSARLGASQTLARLAERFPALSNTYGRLAAAGAAPARSVARGGARLVRVTTPSPEEIRAHLRGQGGAMPEVEIDLAERDGQGRELEWTWNLGGGMWRPFQRGGRMVLRDGAFAIQGRYEIQLRSRAIGDYRTLSTETEVLPIAIDSVGPRILGERAAADGGDVVVPAVDLVSPPEAVELAFGHSGDAAPVTAWGRGRLPLALAGQLVDGSGNLRAWARDELGNQSSALVDLGGIVQVQTSDSSNGCACQAGSGPDAGGIALLALAALLGLARRRPGSWRRAGRVGLFLLATGALASQPACSCGNNNGAGDDDQADDDGDDDGTVVPDCETNEECIDDCEPGTVPICTESQECVCDDDVQWGRIGQYSEMDVAPDGTVWVSAYNSYHGDLMVAGTTDSGRIPDESWQFVDGVPDGPVLVPGSTVRGGINEPGPDVGLYTDIAVAADGAVMVSYFDADTASLKLASNRGGAWSSQVVDEGSPGETTFEIAGQYSAITVRAEGGPGIAYFVHLNDGKGERTELRFAEATVADPAGAADWNVLVVDGAAVPEPSGDALPIPMGVGLFVNAARLADGSPVVVYYDRVNGDLKAARFDPTAGGFAAPDVLDGGGVDVGWYPGLAVDANDQLHVTYVSASNDDLLYVNTIDGVVEVVDDGYRVVGETEDGLPAPEFHFVGDDSGVVLTAAGPYVAYQDATSHELLVAFRDEAGAWTHETVAGNEDPFAGGYGFYVSARAAGDDMVMSTWVIDQPTSEAWIEILRRVLAVE